MDINKKVLILRYGTNIIDNCIERHIEVIEHDGYCWFAKLGKSPSQKVIKQVIDSGDGQIILYSKGTAHICKCVEVTYDKPLTAYPEYYEKYIFEDGLLPSVYFKLEAIEQITLQDMKKLVVCSSRSPVLETLNRSMNSFFLVESVDKPIEVTNKKKTDGDNLRKGKLPENECVYRKDGICHNKSFVSYKYECNRPSNCMGQKR